MDVLARIKSNIYKFQTSGTEQNLVFASRLEKYVLNYTSLKFESQREDGHVTGITEDFVEPLKEVKEIAKPEQPILKSSNAQSLINCIKVSRNTQAFKSRDVGFDLWAEFEDKECEPILEGPDKKGDETETIATTVSFENHDLGVKKETLEDHLESKTYFFPFWE